MSSRWFRNWPLKLGAMVIAAAATIGFYGLIQARPLAGSSVSANTAEASVTPVVPSRSTSQTRTLPAPRPAPVHTGRTSRGS